MFIRYWIVILLTYAGVRQKSALLQDMQYLSKSNIISPSVSSVECYVCGKGLKDGHSITAKNLPNGIVLFCDVHYPLPITVISYFLFD